MILIFENRHNENDKTCKTSEQLKLFDYLKKEIEQNKELDLLGFNEVTLPDQNFMVLLLFNINDKHKIFSKSYESKRDEERKTIKLGFPTEFFDDLPVLSGSKLWKKFTLVPKELW